MGLYFLVDDLEILKKRIKAASEDYKQAAKDAGEACQQGAETTHDNFPFEQAQRDMGLHSQRVADLKRVFARAVVAPTQSVCDKTVGVGSIVKVLDFDTDEYRWIKIGSYLIFTSDDKEVLLPDKRRVQMESISYNSPLGKVLFGSIIYSTVNFNPTKKEGLDKILIVYEIINGLSF